MFIAAYAMCVPHSVQSVFSTGRRASQKLLELIKDIVKKTWAADHIVKANQEELILKFGAFDLRKIASYPSHAKTLRGVGGDVLYLEEAAFLDMAGKFIVLVLCVLSFTNSPFKLFSTEKFSIKSSCPYLR